MSGQVPPARLGLRSLCGSGSAGLCPRSLAVGQRGLEEEPPCLFFVVYSVQPLPKGDQVLNFSDAEDLIDDSKLK